MILNNIREKDTTLSTINKHRVCKMEEDLARGDFNTKKF